MDKSKKLYRTKLLERLCHATVVICFLLAAISGLGMFFPSLNSFSHLFWTPQLARIIHPFLGVIVFCILMVMLLRFAKHNLLTKDDKKWLKSIKSIVAGKEVPNLPIGKYNAGQKLLFWCIIITVCLLLVSGLVIWNRYFSGYFPISVRRFFLLIHSMSGIALILLIMGHVYMAFWVKGSIQSMTTGYVDKKWAKKHHPLWYKEMIEKENRMENRSE